MGSASSFVLEELCIYIGGNRSDFSPGIAVVGVVFNLGSPLVQVRKEVAIEISSDSLCQCGRVFCGKYKSSFPLDDIFFQRPNLGGEHRQSEAVTEREDAALENMGVGQYQNVG